MRIFRRLRRGLPSDARPSRYLLYALGEIPLVVVGILLAIQINDWSVERQEAAEERDYLARILEDLVHDSAAVAFSMASIDGDLDAGDNVAMLMEDSRARADLGRLLPNALLTTHRIEHRTVAFDDLRASGKFHVLRNDEIARGLIDYYNWTTLDLMILTRSSEEYARTVIGPHLMRSYRIDFGQVRVGPPGAESAAPHTDGELERMRGDLFLRNALDYRRAILEGQRASREGSLERLEALLGLIRDELGMPAG